MAGILNKGIKLSYKNGGASYTALTCLQSIPDLGGDVDSIEVTTFDDAAHMYINGLKDYGDSLAFEFLYEKEQFTTLSGLNGEIEWKVELPDGASGALSSSCTFKGMPSIKLAGQGTNDALRYTLSIKPTTEMVFA